ncbi:MAG: thioredoxin domain-containing protein [Candidatus Obscuribacterales bacterium]|nr:thioredoxin domain-containing protein [Candidatus Obscuribacterales bacterium]
MEPAENTKKAAGAVVTVTDSTFEALVINSALPVVVDFWAPWCRPCLAIAPSLEALAQEFAGKLVVAKVNCDDEKLWKEKLGVSGIPHLLFFKGGAVVTRHVGSAPRATFRAKFEDFLVASCNAPAVFSAAAKLELDQIEQAACKRKNEREDAAGLEFRTQNKVAFAEFDAVRNEFLQRMATKLDGDKAALAVRGGEGQFDEEVYQLFVELREAAFDDEEFADLQARQQAAEELANSPEMEPHKEAMFAEFEAADQEYDATIEAARKRLLK